MKLYLMQHALAYPGEANPERPLTPEGVLQAKAAASGMKRLGIKFDLILTSTKRRAQQTAALIAEGVRYPYSDIQSTETLLPEAAPQAAIDLLRQEAAENVLMVGHMPHLANLSGELFKGGVLSFENCGLTCIELCEEQAKIIFHLQAEHFAQ